IFSCSKHRCPCRSHCLVCTELRFSTKDCLFWFGVQNHSIVRIFLSLRNPHTPNDRSPAQSDQTGDRPPDADDDLPSRMERSLTPELPQSNIRETRSATIH